MSGYAHSLMIFFEYFLASAFKQEKADEKVFFLKGSIQAQLKVDKSGFTMDVTRAYSIVNTHSTALSKSKNNSSSSILQSIQSLPNILEAYSEHRILSGLKTGPELSEPQIVCLVFLGPSFRSTDDHQSALISPLHWHLISHH